MEFMGAGCLTEILEQYEYLTMTEPQIARVCLEVILPQRGVAPFD